MSTNLVNKDNNLHLVESSNVLGSLSNVSQKRKMKIERTR